MADYIHTQACYSKSRPDVGYAAIVARPDPTLRDHKGGQKSGSAFNCTAYAQNSEYSGLCNLSIGWQ